MTATCARELCRLAAIVAVASALALGAAGCGDDEDSFSSREAAFGGTPGAPTPPEVGPSTETKAGKAAADELAKLAAVPAARPAGKGAAGKKGLAAKTYTDAELEKIAAYSPTPEPPIDEVFFAEAVDNRDPFRPFITEKVADESTDPADKAADCVLAGYVVDELKLMGIISGIAVPRATFVDPGGTGWTVKKGDCLGRTAGRVVRMFGDEVTLVEASPSTGVEIERVIKLHPGAIDLRKAMKGKDPTALRSTEPLKGSAEGLGVVPIEGAGPLAGPPAERPRLELGMSKASFVKFYGKCFSKRTGVAIIGAASTTAEVWGRSSSAGECADITGGLVILDRGRITSIQAL